MIANFLTATAEALNAIIIHCPEKIERKAEKKMIAILNGIQFYDTLSLLF